jgi:hypothetical protein
LLMVQPGAAVTATAANPNPVCIERSPYPIRKVTAPVPVEGGRGG